MISFKIIQKLHFNQIYFCEFGRGNDNLVLTEIYATTLSYIFASIIASLNLIHIDKRTDILYSLIHFQRNLILKKSTTLF